HIVERCTVMAVETTNDAVSGVRYEREGPPRARIAPSRRDGAQRQGCANERRSAESSTADTAVIHTPCVIAAAGAWTAKLVQPLGLNLPVRWVRSTVARTTPVHKLTDVGVWAP